MKEVQVVFDLPGVTVDQFFATCYADGAFVKRFHSKRNGHDGTQVTPWEDVEDDDGEEEEEENDDDSEEEDAPPPERQRRRRRRQRRLVQFAVPLRMPDFIVRLAGVDSVSVLERQELTLVFRRRERSEGAGGGGGGARASSWLRCSSVSSNGAAAGSADCCEPLESMQLDCSPLLDLAVAQRFSIETGGFLRVERREDLFFSLEGDEEEAAGSPPTSTSSGVRITALIRVSSGGPWGLAAAVEAAMASQAKGEATELLLLAFEALSEASELRGEGPLPAPPGPPRVSEVAAVVAVAASGEEEVVSAAAGETLEEEDDEEVPMVAVRETTSSSSDDDDEFAEDETEGEATDGDDGDVLAAAADAASAARASSSSTSLARALSRIPSSLAALVDERIASRIHSHLGSRRGAAAAAAREEGQGGADSGGGDGDGGSTEELPFQDALAQPPPSAADAEAMLRMLDGVAARLRSLEREVKAARAIVRGSCPELAAAAEKRSFARRLLLSVLPSSSSPSSEEVEEEQIGHYYYYYYSRSSGVAVAAAATAVIAAFVAVRGASSNRSRV